MSIWDERCILAPSLISCCDLCNLEQSVKTLEDGGIELLHVDILDGHFSPSMPLGLDTVAQLRTRTSMPFDVHLMASENDYFVRELLDIGVEQLVFHAETERHIDNRLNQIHAAGAQSRLRAVPHGRAGALCGAQDPRAARDDPRARSEYQDHPRRACFPAKSA